MYYRYGGRGISVCERWRDFENFYADMGDPPEGLTLDRIDNDGDYCPENCRWASRKEQAESRSTTRFFTANGLTLSLRGWADRWGSTVRTLNNKLASRTFEQLYFEMELL
jgi:hypothetical protein